jgi:hypothetical protein
VWDVTFHPEKYAAAEAVPLVRLLFVPGAAFLALALVALAWEARTTIARWGPT